MNVISLLKKKMLVNYLRNADPDKLIENGTKAVLPVFQRAAAKVSAYRNLLEEKGVDVKAVNSLEKFKTDIPLIDKSIFSKYEINELCAGRSMDKIKQASVSSGFSGDFSYGLINKRELPKLAEMTDIFLDINFNISKKKTFLINCLSMGVKVHSGLPLAETSVRADMVAALIKKFKSYFDQFIIVGNPYFLKRVIEDGIDKGMDWGSVPLNLVMGEDWFPEGFRDYLAHLCSIDLDDPCSRRIGSNMGICELGLSLFQESYETIRIRRLAAKDMRLRAALFGEGEGICPILFNYHPYLIFLEEINGELVFTNLAKEATLPFIRYASKDKGRVHSYNTVKDTLADLKYKDYVPEFKLPFVSVLGRRGKIIELNGVLSTPEQIKTGIYDDFEIAGTTTGYFRMSKANNRLRVEIQLREKREPSEALKEKFSQSIAKYVKQDFEVLLYRYRDFPYGMELTYEKKFQYI